MPLNKIIAALLIFTCFLFFPRCHVQESPGPGPTTISIRENRFIDNFGRQVILNGINVVCKSKEENYLFQGGPEFYSQLKEWGINCIRFIIIWDGLEPEPGIYNESYLEEIDKRIQWAEANDLFVVLDMHQDLFSVKYSDGAPEWATLDEGKAHETGAIWSDAYMLSAAVQTAFDNFWANKPAVDGMGIQDHYMNLWKHIARRYANNSTVIGYDIMNEPFPGSPALQATPALLGAYGQLVYHLTGKILSEEELVLTWDNEENRMKALKNLNTKENYSQVFDVLFEINQVFETNQLQSMYQKVATAIREVDQKHILFLEHSYYSNTGVKSSIERTHLPDGNPDPLVAYAPHGYDLVTDTRSAAAASSERINFIFDRIKEKGAQLNMPVWLGEWGAYYRHDDSIIPVARHAVGLIEKNQFGHAYWSYDPGTEDQGYFQKALLRPYPMYTNGALLSYAFDHEASSLLVEWQEDKEISAPSIIFVPWISRINRDQLKAFGQVNILRIEDSDAGWLVIPTNGSDQKRKLELSFNQSEF